jgi:hypothetical protein
LRGPAALLRLFEEAFGKFAPYGPPDPDQQQRELDALSEHIARLKAQIEKLQTEVSALLGTELQIKKKLRRAGVIHAAETGLRVAQKGQYIHVASTNRLTPYADDSRRGRAAMDEIGILPRYRGTIVHAGWWSDAYYINCRQRLCGVHSLRALPFCAELTAEQKAWAEPLKELLLESKRAVAQVRQTGGKHLATKVAGCFRSEEGARRCCRIRSYLSTMRKQRRGVLQALAGACRGAPL